MVDHKAIKTLPGTADESSSRRVRLIISDAALAFPTQLHSVRKHDC